MFSFRNSHQNLVHAFFLLGVIFSCNNDTETDFLSKLKNLEGVKVSPVNDVDIQSAYGSFQVFQLVFDQPVDHNDPNSPIFEQKAYLYYLDESKPMILETSGYSARVCCGSQLTGYFASNYLIVEHRYFGSSIPENLDWQFLTVEQAAADHHQVVSTMNQLFPEPWISTGISKGGSTALLYKRLYPDDVETVVAIVAPILTGIQDLRTDTFLEQVGTAECREKLKNFQTLLTNENRHEIVDRLKEYESLHDLNLSIGYDNVLEYLLLDYRFSFWFGGDEEYCSQIPTVWDADTFFSHLIGVTNINRYDDYGIRFFWPYMYQAKTQTGLPQTNDEHIEHLIVNLPEDRNKLISPDVNTTYNPASMLDLLDWLDQEGNNIIYIYGGIDPYTAAAVNPSNKTNAIRVIQPGANHYVKISDLDDRQMVLSKISEWTGIDIVIH